MDIIEQIEKHLAKPGNTIGFTYGKLKYDTGKSPNRYNLTLEEIKQTAPSLKDFLKLLPSKGFYNGTKAHLRRPNGTGTKLEAETELNFGDAGQPQQNPPQTPMANVAQNNNTPVQQQATTPAAPPAQMGFVPSAQPSGNMDYNLIQLHVKSLRYDEVKDQLIESKDELRRTKLDLDQAKRDLIDLQKKFDTQEDKHQLDKDREAINRQTFMDKHGEKLMETLGAVAPALLEKMGPKQAQPALGSPMAGMSPVKIQFMEALKMLDDTSFNLVAEVAGRLMENPAYANDLMQLLNPSE